MTPDASWRPIHTAPHDESIMVFSQRWGALIAEYSSDFEQWFPRMQVPVSLGEDDGLTHWMPMPEPPPPPVTAARAPLVPAAWA